MTDPCRHAWSGPGFRGRCRWPFSTNCSIGEPLALGANQSQIGAGRVLDPEFGTVGIAEVEFGQIPMQMGFTDVEVAAVDTALEDRKEAFDAVGIRVATNVFFLDKDACSARFPLILHPGCQTPGRPYWIGSLPASKT